MFNWFRGLTPRTPKLKQRQTQVISTARILFTLLHLLPVTDIETLVRAVELLQGIHIYICIYTLIFLLADYYIVTYLSVSLPLSLCLIYTCNLYNLYGTLNAKPGGLQALQALQDLIGAPLSFWRRSAKRVVRPMGFGG